MFLKTGAHASDLSLRAMRTELSEIMTPAGVDLSWIGPDSSKPVERIISVDLRGSCAVHPGNREKFVNHTPLASTTVQDGKVLPFSWIDCGAVERFLGSSLDSISKDKRPEVYGRALARLLAHEFFHVITGTEEHTSTGVSKTAFTVADLLGRDIEFEPQAIALLRPVTPEPVVLASSAAKPAEPAYDFLWDLESSEELLFGDGR